MGCTIKIKLLDLASILGNEGRGLLNESNIACFLSLSETLSFTETAKRLYLTQQAVSRNIMQLESDLNLPLVNRNGKNISLTKSGESCAKLFKELSSKYSEQIELIKKKMTAISAASRQVFRISLISELNFSGEMNSLKKSIPISYLMWNAIPRERLLRNCIMALLISLSFTDVMLPTIRNMKSGISLMFT